MKKLLKLLGILLLIVVILAALLIGVLSVAEYKPADREPMAVTGTAGGTFSAGDTLSVLSWNVGYGALGDNADFFMDGGRSVYSSDKERVGNNVAAMAASINALDPDLVFLQEVDVNSDRSYGMNQADIFGTVLSGRASVFANNFKALYVPYPLPPIGRVDSGLLTLSRSAVASAERLALPCPFSWPIRTVNLKRCLLVSRIPLAGTDRELVAVNLHLEAYDSGEGKAQQTAMLASFLQSEASRGNYVIAGGDFNQLFSNVDASAWPVYEGKWQPGFVEASAFSKDFSLLMDPRTATCRSLDRPLKGADLSTFQFYVIDGFIVSSNVEVQSLETLDMGFVASDHNPVKLQVRLVP